MKKKITKSKDGKLVVSGVVPLHEMMFAYIDWVANRMGDGSKTAVATALGISVRTLYNYIYSGKVRKISRRPGNFKESK